MVEIPDYIPKWSAEARMVDAAALAIDCLRLAEFALDNPQHREAVRVQIAEHRAAIEKQVGYLVEML